MFRHPLRYPDHVRVGARVEALGEDRFTMAYAIASRATQRIVAHGSARVVILDYQTGRKVALPEAIRTSLLALDPGASPQPEQDV